MTRANAWNPADGALPADDAARPDSRVSSAESEPADAPHAAPRQPSAGDRAAREPAAPEAPSAKTPGLKQLAIRGATWTLFGYGASQILRLGSNLILTRLLAPELFGIMALVNVVLQGLQMFSDVGIRPSIIRSERGEDPTFVNVAWTLQVIRGFGLWIVCSLLAWPVALFYEQPTLHVLLPVAALSAVCAGFSSTSLLLANRAMRFERITLVELLSQAVGVAVMIGWALAAPSVWALVVGGIAGAATRTILSHTIVPGIPTRFRWNRDCLRELVSFGQWIFVSTALTFLVNQGDRLLFGKLLSMEMLGVYSIAVMFSMVLKSLVARVSGQVAMPAYSRAYRARKNFQHQFHRLRWPLVTGAGVAASLLILAGPRLIEVLYDPRYASAGWMLQILGVGLVFQALEMTNGSALLATGHARSVAIGSGAKLVGMAAFIPLGWYLAELPGALFGLITAEALKYCTSAVFAGAAGLRNLPADLTCITLAIGLGLVGFAALRALPSNQFSPDILLAGSALVVLVAWAIGYFIIARRFQALRAEA